MTWLSEIADAGISVALRSDGSLKFKTPPGFVNGKLIAEMRECRAQIITEMQSSLDHWTGRARAAQTIPEVQGILDAFRPLPWSDQDRAIMAQACERRRRLLYMPD